MTPQLFSDRVLGRRDVRCRAALSERRSVGAAGALREAMPNICLQMLLRGRNTVGYTPYPTSGHRAFVPEATATGIDIFRIFDALNNVDPMRAGDRRGARNRHRRRRSRDELHRRPVGSGREPLHARLLSQAGRADRRRGRTRARHQGHGRPAARAGGRDPGVARCAASSICRCTCTPTTPPAASWPPTWPPGRRAPTPSTAPSAPLAGTTSQPALSRSWPLPRHRLRHGLSLSAVCDLEPYWEALRRCTRRSSPDSRADRPGVHHEIPGAVVEPAPAGHRAGAWGPVRGGRGAYAAPTGCWAGW